MSGQQSLDNDSWTIHLGYPSRPSLLPQDTACFLGPVWEGGALLWAVQAGSGQALPGEEPSQAAEPERASSGSLLADSSLFDLCLTCCLS